VELRDEVVPDRDAVPHRWQRHGASVRRGREKGVRESGSERREIGRERRALEWKRMKRD
jgi:hypothetical protein